MWFKHSAHDNHSFMKSLMITLENNFLTNFCLFEFVHVIYVARDANFKNNAKIF